MQRARDYRRWPGLALALLYSVCMGAVSGATSNELWDFGVAAQRVEDLKRMSAYLNGLASEPLPKDVTARTRTEGFVFAQWLRNTARKLHHLSRGWEVLLARVPQRDSQHQALITRLQEMNRSFSVQYLELVSQTRKELATFEWSSDVLRERRDRAVNLLRTLQ